MKITCEPPKDMNYYCKDAQGDGPLEISAASIQEAAEIYADPSLFEVGYETIFVDVYVTPIDEAGAHLEGERDMITVVLDPDGPDCEAGHEHDWQNPHEVLGGLTENPGACGKGAGLVIEEVCAHCGAYRTVDTWAQRSDTGEQGLESVAYRQADEISLDWVERRKEDED